MTPEDVERAARMDQGLLASDNYNLKTFFERGGKLMAAFTCELKAFMRHGRSP